MTCGWASHKWSCFISISRCQIRLDQLPQRLIRPCALIIAKKTHCNALHDIMQQAAMILRCWGYSHEYKKYQSYCHLVHFYQFVQRYEAAHKWRRGCDVDGEIPQAWSSLTCNLFACLAGILPPVMTQYQRPRYRFFLLYIIYGSLGQTRSRRRESPSIAFLYKQSFCASSREYAASSSLPSSSSSPTCRVLLFARLAGSPLWPTMA